MQGQAKATGEGSGVVASKAFEAVEQALVAGLQTGLGQQIAGVG
jgi:hypothetical protein